MRIFQGGVAHAATTIESDLIDRDTNLHKSHISGLADLASSALTTRSSNTAEWLSILPRECDDKSKERFISRFLANKLIDITSVMHGFIPEITGMSASNGQKIILMMDQSKISDGFECLMISLRVRDHAIPVIWKVVNTKGAIGFNIQQELLNSAKEMIPRNADIILMADRFYGTSMLVNWCQINKWQYRIRLKGNTIFSHKGGEIDCSDALKMNMNLLEDAAFNNTDIVTNIGILFEKGHKEPWFIAMDTKPSKYKTLDYSMRWGIESMFSDFKSRGFSVTKTQLQHADRIERLILVLTVALYWAVSTGMKPNTKHPKFTKKKLYRSMTSLFKRGLRLILDAILKLQKIPKLWAYKDYVGW